MGGLGNQLFQLGLLLKLRKLYPETEIKIELGDFLRKYHNGFELKDLLNNRCISEANAKKAIEINEDSFKTADFSLDLFFNGYWQGYEYFDDATEIFSLLFSKDLLNVRNYALLKKIENSNSISLHIRRGDYVLNPVHGNIANKQYFQNAIQFLSGKIDYPEWFVFSDDIEWCRANLEFHSGETNYIDWNTGRDSKYDLFLMSRCKHNVISNSSFSWWAQEFNQNPEKIVIKPPYWFNDRTNSPLQEIKHNSISVPNICAQPSSNLHPFFSILIPVYNVENYLRRCLSSAANQTFQNIEIICVDDGSSDGSSSILSEYAAIDERIAVISHPTNMSLRMARDSAVIKSRGEYILFLDGDDWLSEDACDQLHRYVIEKEYPDILEFSYREQPSGRIISPSFKSTGNRVTELLKPYDSYPQTVWNKAYKGNIARSAFAEMEPFYATMAEDAYHSIVLAWFSKTIGAVDLPLYNYTTNSGVSSSQKRTLSQIRKILESMRQVIAHTRSFFKKHDASLLAEVRGLEIHLADSVINGYILSDTREDDKDKSLLLVPEYFRHEVLEPFARELRTKAARFDDARRNCATAKIERLLTRIKRAVLRRFNLQNLTNRNNSKRGIL